MLEIDVIETLRNDFKDPANPVADEVEPLLAMANDRAVAVAYNRKDQPGTRSLLTKEEVQRFCFQRNLVGLWQATARGVDPVGIALASTALCLVFDSIIYPLASNDPDFMSQVSTLVAAGLFDTRNERGEVVISGTANRADIATIGAVLMSRAEELFGEGAVVTPEQIGAAR